MMVKNDDEKCLTFYCSKYIIVYKETRIFVSGFSVLVSLRYFVLLIHIMKHIKQPVVPFVYLHKNRAEYLAAADRLLTS